MAPAGSKTPAAVATLIEQGLFDRLPPTFGAFCFDQVKDWDRLFPAERSYFERLLTLLHRTPAAELDTLFAAMRAAEQRMGVTEATWPKRQFTLAQVDFLNRSPHYPEWRKAVAAVFAQLDPVLEADVARHGRPRLVVVTAPADLPVGPDRMWTRLAGKGKRVPLAVPEDGADYLPLLLTGAPRAAAQVSLADLYAQQPEGAAPYGAWVIDGADHVAPLTRHGGVVRLSYDRLKHYRQRLMAEVQRVVEGGEIRGPRELGAKLKELAIRAEEGEVGRDPVLAEFVRASLLSGNGTLLINNTFVEWATVQAVRRARPTLTLVSFGVRSKVKPFSSLLIYADQEATTPVPTQADTLGSYVDLEVFYQYVWQEFGKYPEYRSNTVYLFVGDGMDELFVIAPLDFALREGASKPVPLATVFQHAKEWLRL